MWPETRWTTITKQHQRMQYNILIQHAVCPRPCIVAHCAHSVRGVYGRYGTTLYGCNAYSRHISMVYDLMMANVMQSTTCTVCARACKIHITQSLESRHKIK